jgi:hypothetical protein
MKSCRAESFRYQPALFMKKQVMESIMAGTL